MVHTVKFYGQAKLLLYELGCQEGAVNVRDKCNSFGGELSKRFTHGEIVRQTEIWKGSWQVNFAMSRPLFAKAWQL